jgi:hypothetical protein
MRILFDQATPVPLRAYLDRHEVHTASQQGWDTLKNAQTRDQPAGEFTRLIDAALVFTARRQFLKAGSPRPSVPPADVDAARRPSWNERLLTASSPDQVFTRVIAGA